MSTANMSTWQMCGIAKSNKKFEMYSYIKNFWYVNTFFVLKFVERINLETQLSMAYVNVKYCKQRKSCKNEYNLNWIFASNISCHDHNPRMIEYIDYVASTTAIFRRLNFLLWWLPKQSRFRTQCKSLWDFALVIILLIIVSRLTAWFCAC